jgi:vesicle-fusing ATPase
MILLLFNFLFFKEYNMTSLTLLITKCSSDTLALTNKIYLNPNDFSVLFGKKPSCDCYVTIKNFVYLCEPAFLTKQNTTEVPNMIRRTASLVLGESIDIKPYVLSNTRNYILTLNVEVDILKSIDKQKNHNFQSSKIIEFMKFKLNNQIFTIGQIIGIEINNICLTILIKNIITTNLINDSNINNEISDHGIYTEATSVILVKNPKSNITIDDNNVKGKMLKFFDKNWDTEKFGIGGLNREFGVMFRRVFASRLCSAEDIKRFHARHVRGMLLYGPPGTGKTLIARQIGKLLNAREPKIVNGPEILNKFVGASEENIRKLFIDAETEYAKRGDDSELHIIIMDELDAICRARGSKSDSTGVGDTVVNQLLTKFDGVKSLNNILIIGMTNRKELIDPALLRPGRMEVHMEIGLPNEEGRIQILRIHTMHLLENNALDTDVDISYLAKETKNFSGAELEGLVQSALSFSINRSIDPNNITKFNTGNTKITQDDFINALSECHPAFGVSNEDFKNCSPNGIINYDKNFEMLIKKCNRYIKQVRESNRTPLLSIILEGEPGTGKTAIATTLAIQSKYPYIKILSGENLVGLSESSKADNIIKCFEDAHRSPLSIIIIDDIERILEFVPIGPRFSNTILQLLMVYFKKNPPEDRQLLIIGTTSNKFILDQMGLFTNVTDMINIPEIETNEAFINILNKMSFSYTDEEYIKLQSCFNKKIAIKKLITLIETAKQVDDDNDSENIVDNLIKLISDN